VTVGEDVGRGGPLRSTGALLLSAHPGPSIAVTVIGTVLGAAVGCSAAVCALLASALLTGQLSIGWSNDAIDQQRDVAAARGDKPVARGAVRRATVWTAAWLALAACVPLSLALGLAAGLVHLLAVAGGWSYNLGLKRHWASFVPFAVSFGLLPAVATLAAPHPHWPPWWAVTAGALLGVSAHLANTLPDLADDRAAGVMGLGQRIGAPAARLAAGLALAGAALVLAVAPPGPVGAVGLALLGLTALLLVGAFVLRWPEGSRTPFALTVAAALGVVALLLVRGTALG
jgi:4-hydroxybenzoate polyprenyltransferase